MKRRTALLIVLLIITVIPAIGFIGLSFIMLGTILDSSGNVRIFVYDDMLEVWGRGGFLTSFPMYVGLSISCIIFFVVLFLLVHDLQTQRRMKQK